MIGVKKKKRLNLRFWFQVWKYLNQPNYHGDFRSSNRNRVIIQIWLILETGSGNVCTEKLYFSGAARGSSVYISFISAVMDAATKETDLNKIPFSHLPCLLCKLRCHAGTAAIRQRMAMVVFLTAYCTRLLLQPRVSRSLVGKRRHGGKGEREISSPPLVICG